MQNENKTITSEILNILPQTTEQLIHDLKDNKKYSDKFKILLQVENNSTLKTEIEHYNTIKENLVCAFNMDYDFLFPVAWYKIGRDELINFFKIAKLVENK